MAAGILVATLICYLVAQSSVQEVSTQPEEPPGGEGSPTEPSFRTDGEEEIAPGRIIVQIEEDAAQADLEEINDRTGARTEEDLPRSDVSVVDLPRGLGVGEAIDRYEASPDVEFAEPDFLLRPAKTPNDPYYGDYMYGLNNAGQTGGTPDADVDAPEAWDVTTGDAGTVVAVIDEGVDVDHPDLDGNLWVNADEVPGNGADDDNNGYVDDVNGYDFANDDASVYDPDPVSGAGDEHGTHVAGTIAAESDNGSGITGMNWDAGIMALKFLGPNGGYTSDAIEALNYAVANGATISNNSWGGGGRSQALQDAIAAADGRGHLFVAAAGNGGSDGVGDDNDAAPSYPASYDNPNVISVAATDDEDGLASFSNYGNASVDLGAPGVGILSTLPNNAYGRYSGTSMATPHVTGAAALMKSRNPGWDDVRLKEEILKSADDATSLRGKTVTGARLNASEALGARQTELALSARPTTIIYGQATALSGKLTSNGEPLAGEAVILEERPAGASGFTRLGEATTSSDGAFDLSGVKPQKNTAYRARFAGDDARGLTPSTSTASLVRVKVKVALNTSTTDLKLGNSRAVAGVVSPPHGGEVTVVVKRNGVEISRQKVGLSEDSRYRLVYKPGSAGTYAFYAVYPGDTDHLGNRSPQKGFKVVR